MKKEKDYTGDKRKTDPDKVYNDELNNRGNELFDSEAEGNARDMAKIEKANSGSGQKMDSVHPDDLEE